jgi:hypothetical protein
MLSPIHTKFRSAAQYVTIPREASLCEERWQETLLSFKEVLMEMQSCFQTKKKAYQQQLTKIQESSNMALRNAMQVSFFFPCFS